MGYLDPAIRAFTSGTPTGRVMRRLLIVCAILPILTDRIVGIGSRFTQMDVLYVAMMTVALVVVVVEVGRALQQIEDRRGSAHERLQLQMNRMPIACVSTAPDFTVTAWNPAAERVFGYSAAEIVGQSALQLLPGGILSVDVESIWRRLLAGDSDAHIVTENVTKDSRTIMCRWSNTPLFDREGMFIGVLSMAEDITEPQRVESALQQSEQRHRDLINSLPHYIFSVDNEDRYLTVNTAACVAFGRPEAEIIGRTAVELGTSEVLAREWTEQNALTRAKGTTETLDTTIVVGGTLHHTHSITSPLLDERGAVVGVTGIAIDTTEEKAAKATTQRLLRAVEQFEEVMFMTDRDGVITYVNPAFERVYGYTQDEAIGKTPRILKGGDRSQANYEQFWSGLLAGRSIRSEYRNRRKDGSLIDVIASASPVVDSDGGITGFIAVQQDITEQKRATEERHRLDERLSAMGKMEALGTLAGGIAHDFNNILSIIVTHASLLERPMDRTRMASAVSTIKKAVQRGATLSRQILTFARRAEINLEPVNVTSLLLELGSMLSETMPRTIKFTLEADPDLPLMIADSGQLHQALLNLSLNACDAMPAGGDLRIESRLIPRSVMKLLFTEARDADYVRIVVADSGSGIDEQTRRRMFEPFFTTKKGKGTGLGLAVVYGVVNSHGGLIDVDSRPGQGTEFRLYFPIDTAVVASPPELRDGVRGGHETLLVVEDEPAILEAILSHLAESGYDVLTANDGPEAIETCRRAGAPDAVIMDLGMPRMIAADLVRALREVAPAAPVLAMTGYVEPAMHDHVIAAGVEHILQKPFGMDEMLGSVRAMLDRRAKAEVS